MSETKSTPKKQKYLAPTMVHMDERVLMERVSTAFQNGRSDGANFGYLECMKVVWAVLQRDEQVKDLKTEDKMLADIIIDIRAMQAFIDDCLPPTVKAPMKLVPEDQEGPSVL